MAIYRGSGGAGDATVDSASASQVAVDASIAAGISANQSAASAAASTASAVTAANSAAAAELAYDSFDDRYLGAKATPPTLDNDGNTILEGALYFNSTSDTMYVWTGTAWQTTTVVNSTGVSMPVVGTTPSGSSLEDWFSTFGSSGVRDGTLTYVTTGSSATKLSVAAGEGFIRTSNDQQADLKFISWAASPDIYTFPAPAAGQESSVFIGVEYNAGSPRVITSLTYSWNFYDNFPLARCSYDGTTVRILNAYAHAEDTASLTRQWIRLNFPFHRETPPEGSGGLEITSSLRALAMSAGKIWQGFNRYSISALSSGIAFDTYYKRAGGGFNRTTGVTSWPNTDYDDGSGTLAALSTNRYGTLWVYLDVADGSLDVIYGGVNTTSLAAAQADTLPSIPDHLRYHGALLARIIFQKSAASATLVESAWADSFTPSSVDTDIAAAIHAATSKTTPVDADELGLIDSAAAWVLKKLTFANLWAWVKSQISAVGLTADLLFTGTGNRIKGDFSNATAANRVLVQSSTANGFTALGIVPNGTSTTSAVQLSNSSDPNNGSMLQLALTSTEAIVQASVFGTGTYLPLVFKVGAAGEQAEMPVSGGFFITQPTGLGYGIGAGGTATQATSKSTSVPLNKPSGTITMHNAALAAGAAVGFTLNNSLIGAGDAVTAHRLGGGSGGNYQVYVDSVDVGVASIILVNRSAVTLSDAVQIRFQLHKGATS